MERRVHTYRNLERHFDEVAYMLAETPTAVLQPATDDAVRRASDVVTTLSVALGPFEVGRAVRITVGDFSPRGVRDVVLSLSWTAADAQAMFPTMQATLEVTAVSLDPPLTQLTLQGEYRPPLGPVGVAGDSILGYRVAEAAVDRFLERIVERIEAELAARDRTGPGAVGEVRSAS